MPPSFHPDDDRTRRGRGNPKRLAELLGYRDVRANGAPWDAAPCARAALVVCETEGPRTRKM